DALEAADRYRLRLGGLRFLDPASAASRLARAVAGAAEDAGKDVRFPVDEVGVGVAAGRDQADVLGNGGVGGASPLAIDHFVKVVGIADVGGSQVSLSTPPKVRRVHCNSRRSKPVDARARRLRCQQGLRGGNNAAGEAGPG